MEKDGSSKGCDAKAGLPVGRSSFHIAEDEDEETVEAVEARRREPQTLTLFYPEKVSKLRHAKRIFGVRPKIVSNNSLGRPGTSLSVRRLETTCDEANTNSHNCISSNSQTLPLKTTRQ